MELGGVENIVLDRLAMEFQVKNGGAEMGI